MNVLVVGSGGREHALGWKLRQSKRCGKLYFLPGNAGTAKLGVNINIDLSQINTKSTEELVRYCNGNKIELIVIGPEDYLAAGLADRLQKAGFKVFGPTADGAKLEADKAYSKQLMRAALVPTAEARTFTDGDQAYTYAEEHETPLVIKAAGLAKGKGVIVCDTPEEACEAVNRIMGDREFGDAGNVVIAEERLTGQEVSILALVSGTQIYVLEPSQDHKQVGEGDTGPNTGGMGAYTPTPLIDNKLMRTIEEQILVPTASALRREGIDFRGVLYAGLMLTPGGPKVLEFNTRFGDPECQPLMMRFKGDLLETMLAVADNDLESINISWDKRHACCVVICSEGYPGDYPTGLPITGLEEAEAMEDVQVFHAGTKFSGDDIVTAGGRVINVVALGDDLPSARDRANEAAAKIKFDGAFYRHDIGDRVLKTPTK